MLGWFQALMPREERFFALFAKHAAIVVAGAESLRGLLQGGDTVEAYCQQTGRSGLPDLNWYFAYNLFRLAGIVQGIVGRARDGTANSPQAAAMEARVPLLGEAAWKYAKLAGA